MQAPAPLTVRRGGSGVPHRALRLLVAQRAAGAVYPPRSCVPADVMPLIGSRPVYVHNPALDTLTPNQSAIFFRHLPQVRTACPSYQPAGAPLRAAAAQAVDLRFLHGMRCRWWIRSP